MPKVPATKKTKPENAAAQAQKRKVEYPDVTVMVAMGDQALTVQQAKDLLGFTDDAKLAKEHGHESALYSTRDGKDFWALNNVRNRPFYGSVCEGLVQEHLQKRYKFNGEPIIIGKTGLILNGQHTLVSIILAEEDRTGKQAAHWADNWPDEVRMEKLIVFGVEETDDVVNTMDTCKPRSLMDVLCRSDLFKDKKEVLRKQAARIMDYAVRLLWERLGVKKDAFAPRRTHAEALAFIEQHKKLVKCVFHIMDENANDKIKRYISPGYASAMCYLMAASHTDGDVYHAKRHQEEVGDSDCDFENWDKAQEFWVLLANGSSADFKALREALAMLADPATGNGGSVAEKTAILAKAWNVWITGKKVKDSDLTLSYDVERDVIDGVEHVTKTFNEVVMVQGVEGRGIDLGNAPKKVSGDDDEADGDEGTSGEDSDVPKRTKGKIAEQRNKIMEMRKAQPPVPATPAKSQMEELEEAKAQHPDCLLIVKHEHGGSYSIYAGDAKLAAATLQRKLAKHASGLDRLEIPAKEFDSTVKDLQAGGHALALAETVMPWGKTAKERIVKRLDDETTTVTPEETPKPKAAAPKATTTTTKPPQSKTAPKPKPKAVAAK